MPIYEYRCKKCNAVNEFLIFGDKKNALACTSCGSKALEKMLSVTNVHSTAAAQCGSREDCSSMGGGCGGGACASGGFCPKH